MKKFAVGLAITASACSIALSAPAQASPGQCQGSPWGGFCDTDWWQDGSFMHGVNVMGFWSYQRVCDGNPPINTDYDPRTPC